MDQRPRKLTLRYSPLVKPRLAEIWQWNADKYGAIHADEYVETLQSRTRELQTQYDRGRCVPSHPSYRYMTLKTRSRGHGYVVVYQVMQSEVFVVSYFHTAQDWPTELKKLMREN